MATTKLSNEFMAKVLEDAAWSKLSERFAWSEQLLEKYKDKVAWKEISGNGNIAWSTSVYGCGCGGGREQLENANTFLIHDDKTYQH